MRIGINLLYLVPGVVGGTETYASGLISGFCKNAKQHEFIVFVNKESSNWKLPDAQNIRKVICPVYALNRWKRYFFEQILFKKWLNEYRIDILHSLGYVAPLYPPCPSVVTIHDLNFRFIKMPMIRKLALEYFVGNSAVRSQRIVADSEFTRKEIVDHLNILAEKISVVHLAPTTWNTDNLTVDESESIFDKYRIRIPYMVAFSNQFPHKNILNLLRAYALCRRQHGCSYPLILIGHLPTGIDLGKLLGDVNADSLVFTGYLNQPELQVILQRSSLLIFPSLYEGFGLPVLEAMSLGIPVVCSECASLPEVAGEAAVYFDPYSVNDMAQKISEVAMNSQLQCKLREKGYKNIERFSWEKTAQATLDVYSKVLGQSL